MGRVHNDCTKRVTERCPVAKQPGNQRIGHAQWPSWGRLWALPLVAHHAGWAIQWKIAAWQMLSGVGCLLPDYVLWPIPWSAISMVLHYPYPLFINALEGGDTPCTEAFAVHYRCLTCSICCLSRPQFYCLSSPRFYCLSSRGHFVCLVDSFRYNGLATLALACPSGPRAGPSGPQCTENRGGIPPLKMVGMSGLGSPSRCSIR